MTGGLKANPGRASVPSWCPSRIRRAIRRRRLERSGPDEGLEGADEVGGVHVRSATAKLATSSSAKGCTFEYDKDKFIVHADVCHAGVTVHTPPPLCGFSFSYFALL